MWSNKFRIYIQPRKNSFCVKEFKEFGTIDLGNSRYKVDLRIARDIPLTERMRIELLAEGFNIFNHSNFNGFNTTIYTVAATTNTTPLATPLQLTPNAGYLNPSADGSPPDGTNARRFQLSIRFRF